MPKGRREPSPTMAGIFTRSRSEVFLHRTRSGRARPDPTGRKRHQLVRIPPDGPPAPDEALPSSDGAIHISIKDLRARRVFSPASISADSFPDQTGKIQICVDQMDVIQLSEKEETGKEALPGSEVRADEEQVQSTPPDLELFRKLDEGKAVAGSDAGSTDLAVKISGDNRHANPELGSSNPSKNKPGIALCSRLKLYRNPSSFAYRRLMPYLKDLAKDQSSGLEILYSHNYPIKVEKNMEERAILLNGDSLSNNKDHALGSEDSPTVKLGGHHDVKENPGSENPKLRPHKGVIDDLAVSQSPDSRSEGVLQVHKVMIETPPESSDFEFKPLNKSPYCPHTESGALSIEELAGNVQALLCLPRKVVGCRTLVPTLEIDRGPALGESRLGSSSPLHALAPKKGILKRHTRGCRGVCMCLDCTSFRLHAERAYEFSKKQMQETDEVIIGLMNELSCLRNAVEKSLVPEADGARYHAILQPNQEQLKRVCRRAFRVEEMAKNRLKQMIHEVNIHCRIPGPRVSFAESVEERSIP